MEQITRKAQAGVNVYACPICDGAGMNGTLFAKLGMRDYARMRVDGSVTRVVGCSNSHRIRVVMERPKGAIPLRWQQ